MTGRAYYLTTLGAWRRQASRYVQSQWAAADPAANAASLHDGSAILAVIEADEGAHMALERDAEFEALPPALAAEPVPARVATALAGYGAAENAGTLAVAKAVGKIHPLLRYRAL